MQDSSGTRNPPAHLLILEYIGGYLMINLMFVEITTLLQLCVEISSKSSQVIQQSSHVYQACVSDFNNKL